MSPITLQQIIEEKNTRKLSVRVIIAGAAIPNWTHINYNFSIGEVPTATITIPGDANLPAAVSEEASVQIWFGYQYGEAILEQLVFGGAVVDSVGSDGHEKVIDCVMSGPRKLTYGYNRRINFEFDTITANEAVEGLMALAGVANYFVDLEAWLIGTAVPQDIEFSTYGEAINKIAEVDGSPWFALPTGMVRVEDRYPIPNETWRRTYFTGVIDGIQSAQPAGGVGNVDALPRITNISRRKYRNEIANFIEVDGAVINELGPNGETNSHQIFETVDGLSGNFPNGAPWIPTPPLFQDFTFANELIDTNAKAFEVAERFFNLKNRLVEELPISVPGDPDVFLCETVRVVDERYSNVDSLYFVKGYRTSITPTSATTSLDLVGGPESGTNGFAAPFAEFYWKYTALHTIIPGGYDNQDDQDNAYNSDPAAKLCEDLPAGTGDDDHGGGFTPGQDKRMVLIGLDGTASQDYDGQIVSYEWTWNDGVDDHIMTGPRNTLAINPDDFTSIEVTLVVTDDSARTGTITKRIYTDANHINPDGDPTPGGDPTQDDTENGGGTAEGECTDGGDPDQDGNDTDPADDPDPHSPPGGMGGSTQPGACNGTELGYIVLTDTGILFSNNNRDWTEQSNEDIGLVGLFTVMTSGVIVGTQRVITLFGTDQGEIAFSDSKLETVVVAFQVPGFPRIDSIVIDQKEMAEEGQFRVWAGTEDGRLYVSQDSGETWEGWFNFGDGYTIRDIQHRDNGLWVIGGNTENIDSLIRIDTQMQKNFVPLHIGGALRQAILDGGGGGYAITAKNQTARLLGFTANVLPPVWTNVDPFGDPDGWVPAIDFPDDGVKSVAPGFDGEFLVSTAAGDVLSTTDNETFVFTGNIGDQTFQKIIWQGLPGKYLGLTEEGFYSSMDYGASWAPMRPNSTFGTEWPEDALGTDLSWYVGPRECLPAGGCVTIDWLEGNSDTNIDDEINLLIGAQWEEGIEYFLLAVFDTDGVLPAPQILTFNEGTSEYDIPGSGSVALLDFIGGLTLWQIVTEELDFILFPVVADPQTDPLHVVIGQIFSASLPAPAGGQSILQTGTPSLIAFATFENVGFGVTVAVDATPAPHPGWTAASDESSDSDGTIEYSMQAAILPGGSTETHQLTGAFADGISAELSCGNTTTPEPGIPSVVWGVNIGGIEANMESALVDQGTVVVVSITKQLSVPSISGTNVVITQIGTDFIDKPYSPNTLRHNRIYAIWNDGGGAGALTLDGSPIGFAVVAGCHLTAPIVSFEEDQIAMEFPVTEAPGTPIGSISVSGSPGASELLLYYAMAGTSERNGVPTAEELPGPHPASGAQDGLYRLGSGGAASWIFEKTGSDNHPTQTIIQGGIAVAIVLQGTP